MNKNTLIVSVAILIVGIAAVGAFVYVHQSGLALEREKIQSQERKDKESAERESTDKFADTLKYNKCVQDAEDARMRDLKINSTSETTDASGQTIYHGNATAFDSIEARAQQAKQACAFQP